MSILTVKDVSYRYPKSKNYALKNVFCEFEEGKVTAIIGMSGSGKSTLLSLLAGLDHPKNGAITLDGVNLRDKNLDNYRRTEVCMIFQSFQLFPLLTVLENVCYPMELNGTPLADAKGKAAELLEKVGISAEKHNRYPANLSGGEQQRVAIARALASGSKVLLADEPTGNLDEENTQIIMGILENLAHEKGICVVVVTHNRDIAERADRVYKITEGMLEEA